MSDDPTDGTGHEQPTAPSDVPAFDPFADFDRRRRRRTRGRLIAAGIAGVMVLALAGWYVVRITRDGPVDVVRSYLTALRDRKAVAALKIAGLRRPTGDAGAFLNTKALSGGWRIKSLKETTDDLDDERKAADVDVTLTNTSTGPVENPDGNSGRFHLTFRAGTWRITNPLVEVRFLNSPLWYVEVGSVRKARLSYPKSNSVTTGPTTPDERPVTLLFPGIYSPYARSGGEMVTVARTRLIVLPGSSAPLTYIPEVKPNQRLLTTVQDSAKAFVDRCVADMAKGGADCGPALRNDGFETSTDYLTASEATTRSWRLIRYPAVGLPGLRVALGNGLSAFASAVTVPGELQLTATGTGWHATQPTTIVQSCLTISYTKGWGTTVGINADGAIVTGWTSPTLSGYLTRVSTKDWFPMTCFGDEGS